MNLRANLWTVLLALLTLAAPVVVSSGCETNASTGRSQLVLLGREEEISMGVQAAPEMVKEFGGAVKSTAIQQYATAIGKKMAAVTEGDRPSLPWEFTMLDSKVINAFALPGGKVFVSRGLASRMTNEAQLAAVIGHEIGHVTAKHINDRMVNTMGAELILAILSEGTEADVVQLGEQVAVLALNGFSRDQESESDSLGMRYMVRVGYNPEGMLELMQILKASSEGNNPPEWMSTHPLPDTRIQRISQELATTYAGVVRDPKYKKNEAEFRRQFLQRLAELPPAAEPGPRLARWLGMPGTLADGQSVNFADPTSWCAHCRPVR